MVNNKPPLPPRADLAAAMRAARAEGAERAGVLADLRLLAMARLTVLRDALAPVLAQVPDDVDLFDIGVMPGDPPRLFIDMVAFVEMARDRRGYCLYQDRRYGRVLLAQAETLDGAVDAVTAYIARRLVERQRVLASDDVEIEPATTFHGRPEPKTAPRAAALRTPRVPEPGTLPPWYGIDLQRLFHPDRWYLAGQVFWFVVEVLGLLAVFGLLLLGVRGLWGGGLVVG